MQKMRVFLIGLAAILTLLLVYLYGRSMNKVIDDIFTTNTEAETLAEMHGRIASLNKERALIMRMATRTGNASMGKDYRAISEELRLGIQQLIGVSTSARVMQAGVEVEVARESMRLMENMLFARLRQFPESARHIYDDPDRKKDEARFETALTTLLQKIWSEMGAKRQQSHFAAQRTMRVALILFALLSLIWIAILHDARQQSRRLNVARKNLEKRVRERTCDLKKARDKAMSASKAKSEFLAVMSHEIRTPLNGILGMTKALCDTNINEDQRSMLDVVAQSGDALLTILNDVLDLSKIEAGKFSLQNVEFGIEDISHASLQIFGNAARSKGLSFEVHSTISDTIRFTGDAARIRQVLNNLLANAVKFTQKGGINITFSEKTNHDTSVRLCIAVHDTGPGIPFDAQKIVFERFTQIDSSLSREHQGAGLGLAICKEFVERMNGAIELRSELGKGSCFSFFIIVEKCQNVAGENPEQSKSVQRVTTKKPRRSLRILVAEDNPTNCMVIKAILSHIKAKVVFVENGKEAIKTWQSQAFDLVLMDIQMPNMNGIEATQAIRQIETNGKMPKTPIVAVTANAMPHQRDEYLAAGMDDLVAKPVEPHLLFAAIKGVLHKSRNGAQETTKVRFAK